MKRVTTRQTAQLLAWLKHTQPQVYRGLARRFTQPGMSGILDSISNIGGGLVNSVTNFFNSQGGQSLLDAAKPFLQTELEKQQIKLNIARVQSGQPVVTYQPGTTTPAAPMPTSTAPLPEPQRTEIPWVPIGIGAGLLLLFTMRR